MKKSLIAKIISITFIIMLILGILAFPFLPKLYNTFKANGVLEFRSQILYYKISLYLSYIISLLIIYHHPLCLSLEAFLSCHGNGKPPIYRFPFLPSYYSTQGRG